MRIAVGSPTHWLDFTRVQIQPTNVRTRNGYPRAGRGAEVGSRWTPQIIWPADTANSKAATIAVNRIHMAKVFGTLIRTVAFTRRWEEPSTASDADVGVSRHQVKFTLPV